jgi:hypothetical protein
MKLEYFFLFIITFSTTIMYFDLIDFIQLFFIYMLVLVMGVIQICFLLKEIRGKNEKQNES